MVPPGNLRPPEVQAAAVAHDRAADHDVGKVGDDEVGVMNVNVQAQAGEEEPSEAADHEQANEAERIDHRRGPGDRTLVERSNPIKNIYPPKKRHQQDEGRKRRGGGGGLAAKKHMVSP